MASCEKERGKDILLQMMRRFLCIFSLFLLPLLTGEVLYFLREGFSPRRLQRLDLHTTGALSEETKQILSQHFYYLGRGRQSFAFSSEDGKYVLKCPRTDIYKIPFWARVLPFKTYRALARSEKAKRQRFVFESFRIASEELKEETGTLAIHLGSSNPTDQLLHLVDALGMAHAFPLDTTHFVLQLKRDLWTPLFLAAVKKKNQQEKERLLHAFVDVVILRAKKGVLNKDRSFLRNYGFDGEKVYQIDVGDFFYIQQSDRGYLTQKCAHDTLEPVKEWLAKTAPEMLPLIEERLEKL